jgi:hypothetical protein
MTILFVRGGKEAHVLNRIDHASLADASSREPGGFLDERKIFFHRVNLAVRERLDQRRTDFVNAQA